MKFARDIKKEIENQGHVVIPEGYATGEAYEKWLYEAEGSEAQGE